MTNIFHPKPELIEEFVVIGRFTYPPLAYLIVLLGQCVPGFTGGAIR